MDLVISNCWLRLYFSKFCQFYLVSKLKASQMHMERWNKEIFGNVSIRKRPFNQIASWDANEMEGT